MGTAVYRCMEKISEAVARNKVYLTDLDAAIGDGDHGINLERGFGEVMKQLSEEEADIGMTFKKVAMVLISKVGGASGPLYGTAFLKAGSVGLGKQQLTTAEIQQMLKEAIEGIKYRGKAVGGEKTMLDALEPALSAFQMGVCNNKSMNECWEMACIKAKDGVSYTETIIATKGRASYLGERSMGHPDPGATSSLIILEAIRDFYIAKSREEEG